jgi:hypothetical protein
MSEGMAECAALPRRPATGHPRARLGGQALPDTAAASTASTMPRSSTAPAHATAAPSAAGAPATHGRLPRRPAAGLHACAQASAQAPDVERRTLTAAALQQRHGQLRAQEDGQQQRARAPRSPLRAASWFAD